MSTYAFVDTYAYTATYVTDKLLLSVKEIIRESGLSVSKMSKEWVSLERGISTWIRSKHLEKIVLEIFDPNTSGLITRWDLEIVYGYGGDGSMWADTDAIRYSIKKAGVIPASCNYEIRVTNKPNWPTVEGWSTCRLRSTAGLSRYSIGTSVGGSGLGADIAYWGR